MNLSEFAAAALLLFSSWINVHPLPSENAGIWRVERTWTEQQNSYHFSASTEYIPEYCRTHSQDYIEFPVVIHGAHKVFLDGLLLESFGDPSFNTVRSFYGTLVIKCSKLMLGKTLTWHAYSYSQYFARIAFWPKIKTTSPNINIYQETLNAVVAGGLLTLALISIFVFWGQVSHHLTISLVGSGLAFAAYFIATTPAFFNLNISMLTLHKLADFSLWLGTLLLFNVFRFNGLFGKNAYAIYCIHVIFAIIIISLGQTGDVIQFGTTIPFLPFFCLMGMGLVNLLAKAKNKKFYRTSALQILSLSSFIFISVNDLLVILGLVHGPVLLSIGVLGSISFLALGVHEKIAEAYRERDYLRHHLEDEVANKTSEIFAKTAALETALSGLRVAQADLIQSSKMASLGMLAAGIAHEINNSLNYVNGSIVPLKRLLHKTSNFEYAEKAQTLLQVMQDGLHLTFDIMNSLRTFSGLNQAKIKDLVVCDLVHSTLTILNNRIPAGVKVDIDIPSNLELSGNAAAINQVLMNLIVNSLDALGEQGKIRISAIASEGNIVLCVQDNGPGIPSDIRDRVFDPFFTTKEVGKGTGLGLHISRREIQRHGGTLKLDLNTVQGSTFTITLPKPLGEDAACNL